jgi:hypothetical protein
MDTFFNFYRSSVCWQVVTTKMDDNRGRIPAVSLFGRLHARVDKTKLVVAPITYKLHVNE